MIQTRLHKVAAKHGIENAYQFTKATGLPNAMGYYLWQKDWRRIDLKTLNLLCMTFSCTPNDLLEFTPDIEE